MLYKAVDHDVDGCDVLVMADDPDDLGRVMTHARQLGAEYVLFDRDAPPSDALPVFDD